MRLFRPVLESLALLTSFGTLVCCALPALFVALGAGASLVGLVSAFPALVVLSEHKAILFGLAGFMLLASGAMRYMTRNAPCPLDPKKARSCQNLRRYGFYLYLFSVIIYGTGFFFAYLAPLWME